ncbi:MAG: glycosyltransferase family 2 protein [Bacteroidales bacterium]|nr:glycosyltransferase family 2 protein [Bacteroidales bacterium]
MYNYSIIIPHKNYPDLLQRALDSIPEKDDIQVIIVDDNSDKSKVDFKNFPGLNRKNTIVVFDKSGKGAGRARNIGLSKIDNNTKWVTFLDADDFYSKDAEEIFENYKDNKSDIVYFHCDSVYSDTLEPSNRKRFYMKKISQSNNDKDILKYKMYWPWGKIISYKIINENNIKFDEVIASNDAMFSVKVGHASKNIEVSDRTLYIVTESSNSLVKQVSLAVTNCRYNVAKNINNYLKTIGKFKYHINLFGIAYKFKSIGFITITKYMLKSLFSTPIKYLFKDLKECIRAIY